MVLAVLLGTTFKPVLAQDAPPAGQNAPPAADLGPNDPSRGGIEIPLDGESVTISTNTSERFTVWPYHLYDAPYSTREEVATVELDVPPGQPPTKLPTSFTVQTNELVGATVLVLPIVKEGEEPREVRVEMLVLDQISTAYKSYLEATIRRLFPTVSVEVIIANAQTAVLNGYVDKAEYVQPISDLVRGFLAARTGVAPAAVTVVEALRVTGSQQVQLKVIVAEVSRTKVRDLGFEWAWFDNNQILRSTLRPTVGLFEGALSGSADTFVAVPSPNVALANTVFSVQRTDAFSFYGFLRAVVENQLGKILAEPTIVAMSGQPAYFNSGGETPLLIPQGNQTLAVEYRPFGTNVRFVPTVLGDGRIRLEVRPEVSELDPALGIQVSGTSVPGFRQRVVETTVELESGQTFALAGLIQRSILATRTKIPFLGDLPALGWAFQTKSYQQVETELLIVVTPYLVNALDQRPCKLPGNESRIPNDVEYYLGSKFEPPCFDDPYRDSWKHENKGRKIIPLPVRPYDNYGQPPVTGMHGPMDPGGMNAMPIQTNGSFETPDPGSLVPAPTPQEPMMKAPKESEMPMPMPMPGTSLPAPAPNTTPAPKATEAKGSTDATNVPTPAAQGNWPAPSFTQDWPAIMPKPVFVETSEGKSLKSIDDSEAPATVTTAKSAESIIPPPPSSVPGASEPVKARISAIEPGTITK
ncbi:type II and III secretion system protein family protein [Kolteria novifilia]